ncbi:MAG: hypothetical protein FWG06_00230 [Clostridiales bacterium]|nr:hypothetical protein [Clostridiales bacterium]
MLHDGPVGYFGGRAKLRKLAEAIFAGFTKLGWVFTAAVLGRGSRYRKTPWTPFPVKAKTKSPLKGFLLAGRSMIVPCL